MSINEQSHVVTTQPLYGHPFEQFHHHWNASLCSCCNDVKQCCYAHWCWCCFLGSLAGKIGESSLSCCCVPNALALYRMKVRSVLRIQGDSCDDYCATCCCPFCAGLQIQNELRYRRLG